MSQQIPQNKPLGGGGGSVRRARERVEAGLPPDVSQMPPQQRAYGSQSPPQNRAKPQLPPALAATRAGQGSIGVAISRPTQIPQWPLAGSTEGADVQSIEQNQPPPNRGPAPQRPPRPSHVPSMLDASRLQDHTPSFQYRPQQNMSEQNRTQTRGTALYEEDTRSPDITSPMTQSSRPSTISSVGSIPDFPVPVLGPPRKSAHLGPPPSARRGASSYYSQASFVSPIPEESPRIKTQHGSYASSAAIPSSWGSEYEFDEETPEELYERELYERGESRESTNDDGDERGLIRSASIGKRAKPSMIVTKSSEGTDRARSMAIPNQSSKLERMGVFGLQPGKPARSAAPSRGNEAQREIVLPTGEGSPTSDHSSPQSARGPKPAWPVAGYASSPLAGGTGLLDASTSSLDLTVPATAKVAPANEGVSPLSNSPDSDTRAQEMLGAYKRASTLHPGEPSQTSRNPSPNRFSRLSAIRRPPKLDMDAVRDAEARGSLTSLPDLIRRATRLAAMMDRGKRPASRMNDLNDFPMDEKAFEITRDYGSPDEKYRSGISGMLAAFPPPGMASPRGSTPRGERPLSQWPEVDGTYQNSGNQGNVAKKRRRCCGLPCWGFFAIILLLLIIIAAAIVVPLELLVFRKPQATRAKLSPIQQCEANTSTACQNGGTSLLDNGSCSCVCTNGFTGSTCSVAGATGCTTTTIDGLDATLGDSLPRLLTAAQTNFSVPLNANTLLARFNSANLSCSSENALITFDGMTKPGGNAEDEVTPVRTGTKTTPTQNRRQMLDDQATQSQPVYRRASATESIIYDSSAAPTVSPASATSANAPTATDKFIVTENVLDFTRVVVLYVLQEEQLNNAVNAQTAIQAFFDASAFTNRAAMNVSLGNGNTINLVGFSVDLRNGNGTVGGKTSTVRRRAVHRRSGHVWSAAFQ